MKNVVAIRIALAASLCLTWAAVAQQTDPWVGTWTLNVEKSKADPGPLPKSLTLRIEAVAGGAQKHTAEAVTAKDEKRVTERTAKYDGVEVPVDETPKPAHGASVTNSFRRLDERSFEVTTRRDGKVTNTSTLSVSPDGKTMTQTSAGLNLQGQKADITAVFEKQ
jgi:hypothetical protein